jgi:selenide,water dikinase
MSAVDLASVLQRLPARTDPRLILGHTTFDDAALIAFAPGVTLVQTVDFFAPIVDDPYEFGRVAAANALSDVYAMGGEPVTALAIAAFPVNALPTSVLADILRGGESVVHSAGALLVGGHTIIDQEVKFGLAVTGRVDAARTLTNAAARPGDVLVLTKPLGTGILATQSKRGRLLPEHNASLVASMTALNADASRAAIASGARAATDVTGFGLLGHTLHMARASGITARIDSCALPLLPGVTEAIRDGVGTGGSDRNERFVARSVRWDADSGNTRAVLFDPQTSGGLLVAVPSDRVGDFRGRLAQSWQSWVIGDVGERGDCPLVVT